MTYEQKLRRIKMKNVKRIQKQKLRKEKRKYKVSHKPTTTKLFMAFIFVNCTAVEIYSMYVMYYFADLSALYSLIGAVVGESIAFAVYCAKAFKETKEEEQLKFEREKFNIAIPITDSDNDNGVG